MTISIQRSITIHKYPIRKTPAVLPCACILHVQPKAENQGRSWFAIVSRLSLLTWCGVYAPRCSETKICRIQKQSRLIETFLSPPLHQIRSWKLPNYYPKRQFHHFVKSFPHSLTSAFLPSNLDWLYWPSSLVKLRAAAISAPKQQQGSTEIDLGSTSWIIERLGLKIFSLVFRVFSGIFSTQSQGVETQPLHVPRCYKPSLQVLHHDDHNRVAGPPKHEQSLVLQWCFW